MDNNLWLLVTRALATAALQGTVQANAALDGGAEAGNK